MRVVGFVSGDVLRRYDGVERFRQPALGERDEVAIAVGEKGQLPAVSVKRAEGRTHVRKNRPVRDGRCERRGVVVLEVELERGGGATQRLGEDEAVASKRFLFLDLSL